MNLLFWGQPGTGKTEFVKYLGRKTGSEVMIKRYSDLESPYVGETEQNINRAFRQAERTKSILFIDEADSFFTSREAAHHSWEVSRTNEFLTQMENFNSILVCCTNLLPDLDRAAMRRFNWKVEFKPMKPDARLKLYKKHFSNKSRPVIAKTASQVSAIEGLTPGDIKVVSGNFNYYEPDELTHEMIIDALKREVAYRKQDDEKKVGF